MSLAIPPNPNKALDITAHGSTYARFPIRTRVVMANDDIVSLVKEFAAPHILPGDILCISERVVAITEGRSYPIDTIHPSWLARTLSRFVYKSPYGIGIASPWTMHLAIQEAGLFRILVASLAALLTKPFGLRGIFYRVAGRAVAGIDGPCDYTLPPYNRYATLAPKHPKQAAKTIARAIGIPVGIIDANDLGFALLGSSDPSINQTFLAPIFRDNPLGQTNEQTPMCIVRKGGDR